MSPDYNPNLRGKHYRVTAVFVGVEMPSGKNTFLRRLPFRPGQDFPNGLGV